MNLSVILCTHQPDPEVLGPSLEAIAALQWPAGHVPEIVVVDNASPEPLSENDMVRSWLARTPGARVVREDRLGLSFARARAFREARGDWIICFDDDNLPAPNYLLAVAEAVAGYPEVGVWGAGKITVEWLPGADPRVMRNFASLFQQRSQDEVSVSRDPHRPSEMPIGTGMVVSRAAALCYVEWVEEGQSRITDRCGTALSSASDIQLGWLAMQSGMAVGRHPAMLLRHLIPPRRARMDYVARLIFGTASSYAPAKQEVFGAQANISRPRQWRVLARLMLDSARWMSRPKGISYSAQVARNLGGAVGRWQAFGINPPWWVRRVARNLHGGAQTSAPPRLDYPEGKTTVRP